MTEEKMDTICQGELLLKEKTVYDRQLNVSKSMKQLKKFIYAVQLSASYK